MSRAMFPVLVGLLVPAFDPKHADDIATVELRALEREGNSILEDAEVFEHTADVVALGNRNYYRNRTVRDVRDEDALRGLRAALIMSRSENAPYRMSNLEMAVHTYLRAVTGVEERADGKPSF